MRIRFRTIRRTWYLTGLAIAALIIATALSPMWSLAAPLPAPATHAAGAPHVTAAAATTAPQAAPVSHSTGATHAVTATPASQPAPHETSTPIALGLTGPWDVGGRMDAMTKLLGTTPKIEEVYMDWSHQGFLPANMDAIVARGATPVLSWEPEDYTQEPNPQPNYTYAKIINGTYDTYIRQFARDAKAWNKHLYLKLAAEMNIPVYPWGVGAAQSGNTSAQFVTMWRHTHDIFAQEGATNVLWVWCPNVIIAPSTPFADVYPGDAYVDWVGLDGYNWGTVRIGWQTFSQVFSESYNALNALTTKPIMICEVASNESGGSKSQWITQSFLTDIPTHFPRIKAVIWFDEVAETDWRFRSSTSAQAAFKAVAQSPLYQGRLP